MTETPAPPRDYVMPAKDHPGNSPKRLYRRRRRGLFGWYGFPPADKALWHLVMMLNHFLSMTGWRP